MSSLDGRRVFLSASFPSGERGEAFRPYDVGATAAAVTALAHAVLLAEGRLVFGAHPTISPLVLLVAGELDRHEVVEIHQSEYFEGQVPEETLALVDRGFGTLRWWPRDESGDLGRSLEVMRRGMLGEDELAAGVFIGGMQGVVDEYRMLAELQRTSPRLPLPAPGGAAAELEPWP
jgi:SLOG cluster3 family